MEKRGVKFGILLALCLSLYFLGAYLLGYAENVQLRYFNGFIMAGIVVLYLRGREKSDDLFALAKDTFLVSVLGSGIFLVGLIFFNAFMPVSLFESIELPHAMANFDTSILYVVLAFESLFSSLFISYFAMIVFRKEHYKSYREIKKAE